MSPSDTMTRPKHDQPKPTGRPYISAYDHVSKTCSKCGRLFYLRERKFQSLNRFKARKFCSPECAGGGRCGDNREAMFWAKVVKGAGCWEWQGRLNHKGYGVLSVGGKDARAHRYSYEVSVGPIPDGKMILHSCDNRRCVNPAHLRPGTAKENVDDAVSRGRWPRAKLAADVVAAIRSDTRAQDVIAHDYGVSQATISRVKRGVYRGRS